MKVLGLGQAARKLSSLGLVFVAFCISGISVDAQGGSTGLSISPVVFEINADPGDILVNHVKVLNPTGNTFDVEVDVDEFTPIGEEGEVALTTPDENVSTYSVASWTTVSPQKFTLGPREQKIVEFVINVPYNAEPGGHYASIAPKLAISSGSQVSGSGVVSKVGSLLLIRISGSIEEDLIIDTFSASEFSEYGPIPFSVKFRNVGNVHVKPAGFITVTDILGNQVAEITLPQNNVIPDAVRQANVEWEEVNLVGRYTATLVANYGSGSKKTVTATYAFTVFPIKTGIIVGAIIFAILILLYLGRRRIKKSISVLFESQPAYERSTRPIHK